MDKIQKFLNENLNTYVKLKNKEEEIYKEIENLSIVHPVLNLTKEENLVY